MQQLERANGSVCVNSSVNTPSPSNHHTANKPLTQHHSSGVGSLIVPNGLEMALQPLSSPSSSSTACYDVEARVITLAIAPYSIVSVNEGFIRLTSYTQMDAEGKTVDELLGVGNCTTSVSTNNDSSESGNAVMLSKSSTAATTTNAGSATSLASSSVDTILSSSLGSQTGAANSNANATSQLQKTSKHPQNNVDMPSVSKSPTLASTLISHLPTHTTLLHKTKDDTMFVNFISSYPLTNMNNQVTHLLHVCRELRSPASNISAHAVASGGGGGSSDYGSV